MFGSRKKTLHNELVTATSPVSRALILICEKCGKSLTSDDGDNGARYLQKALKEKIKAAGLKREVRAVVTSCIDLCPKNALAIGILRSPGQSGASQFFSFSGNLDEAADQLFGDVL